jgi:hypothetical protein
VSHKTLTFLKIVLENTRVEAMFGVIAYNGPDRTRSQITDNIFENFFVI